MINKYGIACVLQEITDIYKEGRKADHETSLITDLQAARTKFLAGDRVYMDARITEVYGSDT